MTRSDIVLAVAKLNTMTPMEKDKLTRKLADKIEGAYAIIVGLENWEGFGRETMRMIGKDLRETLEK